MRNYGWDYKNHRSTSIIHNSMETKKKGIVINGRTYNWPNKRISHDELALLCFNVPFNKNTVYTITCKDGKNGFSVDSGDSVVIKRGMIFNITATNKA